MKAVSPDQRLQRRSHARLLMPVYYIIAAVLTFYALGPLLVLVFDSLKSDTEIGLNPLGPPIHPLFSNFAQAWIQGDLGTTMRNSTIITCGTILGVWVIASMAAYALTHLDLPGKNAVFAYLIVSFAIPFQLFLVPLYFLFSRLHLTDNLLGLIIIYWAVNSPFAILLLRSFMLSLPHEFIDAARVDGANDLQILVRILVPLSTPGFLTVGLVVGFAAWNEFTYAVTFIQDNSLMPVSTSFLAFQQSFHSYWGLMDAAALIIILPIILLFIALQRRFIEGVSAGGLRG